MLERKYQENLIKKIEYMFPGCIVLKNDANYLQGFPDLLILYKNHWAALETKKNEFAHRQPNQEYYVTLLDGMSYANFIFPENESEVLSEIQSAFES